MSKPTDMDVLNELFTGEVLEPEPLEEPETFAASQAKLAQAFHDLLEAASKRPEQEFQQSIQGGETCHTS